MTRQRMRAGVILSMATSLAWAQQTKAPSPVESGAVIRTETRQVLVDAVVTDKKGDYVRDLTAKNFKVWEDNKEQAIKSFAFEADPASPTNSQKRYLVLFFDNSTMNAADQVRARQAAAQFIDSNAAPDRMMAIANFSGSLQLAQNFTANADRLKAVVNGVKFSSVNANDPGDATSQAAPQLAKAAADFGARGMILSLRNLAKSLGSVPGRKTLILFTTGFPVTPEQMSEVTATISVCNKANVAIYPIDVRGLTTSIPGVASLTPSAPAGGFLLASFVPSLLSSVPGTVTMFQRGGAAPAPSPSPAPAGGGGTGTRGGSPSGPGASSPGSLGGASGGGVTRSPTTGSNPGPTSGNPGLGTGGRTGPGPGAPGNAGAPPPTVLGRNPNMPSPYNQSRDLIPKFPESTATNQQFMYMLAQGTGGFVIANTNDLLGGLQKIGKEQNLYYTLGYTPPESLEGSCHTLRVKVDRSGANVRFRTGYCNSRPQDLLSGNPVEKTLESRAAGAQAGNVAATMQAPFFYTSSNVARVNVAMEINAGNVKFEKVKNKLHAAIDVLGIAYLPDGSIGARFSDTVKLDFDDKKEIDQLKESPLHYENQFDIASGKYNLTVVFSSGGEGFGKLQVPLVVEPYEPKDFNLSGLALSKQARRTADLGALLDASLLDDRTMLIVNNIQIVPTGSNRFKKSEQALLYFEIYEPLLVTPDPQNQTAVAIQMRIVDKKSGEQKVDTGLMRIDLPKEPGNPVIPLGEKMPVNTLTPGSYTLELLAADTAGKDFKRTVDFEIE